MTIEVELPDGTIVEFPDGTSQDVMRQALQSRFGAQTQSQAQPAQTSNPAPEPFSGPPLSSEPPPMPEGMVFNPATGQVEDMRSPANPNVSVGHGTAAAVGGMQGLGFEFGDEAVGAIGALTPEGSEYQTAVVREIDRRNREQHPASYWVPKVAGGVASSLSLARALGINPAQTMGGRVAQGAGLGGVEGAAYGAGSGTDARSRIASAILGGGVGGTMGALAPVAVAGLGAAGRAAARHFRSAPDDVAAAAGVRDVINRSGRSAPEIQDLINAAGREGQDAYRLVDAAGAAGRRRLSSLVRTGNDDLQQETIDFLRQRNIDQADRIVDFTDEALDLGGQTARATREAAEAARKGSADVAFDGIRAEGDPVNLGPVIADIDDRLAPFLADDVRSPIRSGLQDLRDQLIGRTGDPNAAKGFSSVFAVRRSLRDAIDNAYSNRNTELGRELKAVRDRIDNALADSSSEYRQAMADYARQSRNIDAFGAGSRVPQSGQRAADTAAEFARLSPDEQAAYRVGYGDTVAARAERAAGEATNRARPLTSSKSVQEMDALALDPALWRNRVAREMDMSETGRKVMGGSETMERMADDALPQGIIASLLRGDLKEAGIQGGIRGASALRGENAATRRLIAQALLSRDVDSALAPLFREEMTRRSRGMIGDALLRSVVREDLPTVR